MRHEVNGGVLKVILFCLTFVKEQKLIICAVGITGDVVSHYSFAIQKVFRTCVDVNVVWPL